MEAQQALAFAAVQPVPASPEPVAAKDSAPVVAHADSDATPQVAETPATTVVTTASDSHVNDNANGNGDVVGPVAASIADSAPASATTASDVVAAESAQPTADHTQIQTAAAIVSVDPPLEPAHPTVTELAAAEPVAVASVASKTPTLKPAEAAEAVAQTQTQTQTQSQADSAASEPVSDATEPPAGVCLLTRCVLTTRTQRLPWTKRCSLLVGRVSAASAKQRNKITSNQQRRRQQAALVVWVISSAHSNDGAQLYAICVYAHCQNGCAACKSQRHSPARTSSTRGKL